MSTSASGSIRKSECRPVNLGYPEKMLPVGITFHLVAKGESQAHRMGLEQFSILKRWFGVGADFQFRPYGGAGAGLLPCRRLQLQHACTLCASFRRMMRFFVPVASRFPNVLPPNRKQRDLNHVEDGLPTIQPEPFVSLFFGEGKDPPAVVEYQTEGLDSQARNRGRAPRIG